MDNLQIALDKTHKDDITAATALLKADLPKALSELMGEAGYGEERALNEWC